MNAANAKDIRNSHIDYLFNPDHPGNVRKPIRTTYQDRISDNAKGNKGRPAGIKTNLHNTNFLIGTDNPDFTTEMKSKYVDYGRAETPATDFGRRFQFHTNQGPDGDKVDYTTEAKAKFTRPTHDPSALGANKEFAKDLRKEHFVLGNEPADMTTYYHLYHDKLGKDRSAAELNIYQLNDVKKSHFNFGDKGEIGITHYVDQHRWLQPVPRQEWPIKT